ncbi:MAG: amidohydrolase [Acetomicrobium flavidum]|uniref:amidohydrolase n=1 Tax=Acetomicrobium flavidum TaxID=49896 RepID=UPI0016A7FD88|nr:amidohydrolase [Acetomicrobium flavidum]
MSKKSILLRGGTLFTITQGILEKSDILVEDGIIKDIGEGLSISNDVKVVDVTGCMVTPGFIDPHTHIGLIEEGYPEDEESVNEATNPITPHLRVIDAINPYDRAFDDALLGGVTTVQVLPGSANVLGGQGAIIKTYGKIIDRMVRKFPSGMKAAFGENPKNLYRKKDRSPATRMAVAAILREALMSAQDYGRKKTEAEREGKTFDRDMKREALLPVLNQELPLRIHAHRADDILTAIRIADEFNIKITLEHGTEGDKIAGLLAERQIPVAYGPAITSRSKLELQNRSWEGAVKQFRQGVHLCFTTDHPVVPINHLVLHASLAASAGIPPNDALASITIKAAEHIGMENQLGSIDKGKVADLLVWDGDPLNYMSHLLIVIVEGEVVIRRD